MKFSELLNNAENIDNKVMENVIRSWKSPGKVQEFWVLLGVGTLGSLVLQKFLLGIRLLKNSTLLVVEC